LAKVCFLDNDIIHKLVAFQLFEEAIAVLQIVKTDLRVLPTARFFFQAKRKQQIQYPDAVWAEVSNLVAACSIAVLMLVKCIRVGAIRQFALRSVLWLFNVSI